MSLLWHDSFIDIYLMLEHCLLWVNIHDFYERNEELKRKREKEERREGERKAGRENVRKEEGREVGKKIREW